MQVCHFFTHDINHDCLKLKMVQKGLSKERQLQMYIY